MIRNKEYTISVSYPTKTKTLEELKQEIDINYSECN